MDKKTMNRRAYALEAALKAVSRGIAASGATSVDVEPEEVLAYAKFILGSTEKKRRRSRPDATSGQPVGEDPGDRETLLQWAEEVKRRNAEQERELEGERLERLAAVPAEKWETREGATEAALEVLDVDPEDRVEAGGIVERVRRTGPLGEDELLAVAGSELYPPYDQEPSRELRIRNRKGEVWKWAEDASGWTSTPEGPWRLHCQWASSEMSRRGPWHVI